MAFKRSIRFECFRCKRFILVHEDDMKNAIRLAREFGWMIGEKEWNADLCPLHWKKEQKWRKSAGFEIITIKGREPKLRRLTGS